MGLKEYFGIGKEADAKENNTKEKELLCPKCNVKMIKKTRQGVTIDKCMGCGGIWLDKGEIFRILQKVEPKKGN